MTIPPLSWHAGKFTVFCQRQYSGSAKRFPEAMRLTPEHVQALDMFDALASDPALHLAMRLQPGGMPFVCSHPQLHGRTGFTGWPEPGRRELPECFKQRYGSITPGSRGGIITKGTRLHAPLD